MSIIYKIRKYAQEMEPTGSPPSYWQKVKDELLKVPSLSSEIKSILSSVDKIVFNTRPPKDEPNAIAYVSSGDANENSKPDKIHFVLSNMPPNISDDQFAGFIQQIESILVHEKAHIQDYNPATGQFPGGEGAAHSAEQSFKPELPPDMVDKVAKEFNALSKISLDFSNNNTFKVRR
jgi:hypothetical protein